MPTKRIDRDELIRILTSEALNLSNLDFTGVVSHFFKDDPEWRGTVNRSIKQVRSTQELEQRCQTLLDRTLKLKRQLSDLKDQILIIQDLQHNAAALIASQRLQLAAMIDQIPGVTAEL